MIAIDFGTTNTSVAYLGPDDKEPRALALGKAQDPYHALFRSAYLRTPEGVEKVGEAAVLEAGAHPEAMVALHSFKPKLNQARYRRDFTVSEYVKGKEYDFLEQSNLLELRTRRVRCFDALYRKDYVGAVASILGEAVRRAGDSERRPILPPGEQLVLGVPIHFSPRARRRLADAVVRAGIAPSHRHLLDRVRFVYEPVALSAVALSPMDVPLTALIFDFGGGTLDLALVDLELDQDYGVMVPVRLRALGGTAWAGARIDTLVKEAAAQGNAELAVYLADVEGPSGEPIMAFLAAERCKQIKEELSVRPVSTGRVGPHEVVVSRADLEDRLAPLLAEIGRELDRLCQEGGVEPREVQAVAMGGGSSAIPAVRALLRGRFPRAVDEGLFRAPRADSLGSMLDAITGIAKGLAMVGHLRSLVDVYPFDYQVWDPRTRELTTVARRGQKIGAEAGPVKEAALAGPGLGLYQDLFDRPDLVLELGQPSGHFDDPRLRIDPGLTGILPRVELEASGREPLVVFDSRRLSGEQLRRLFELDLEYAPDVERKEGGWLPCAPLGVGDHVVWRENGYPGYRREGSGVISHIRRVSSRPGRGGDVFDLEDHVLTVIDLHPKEGASTVMVRPVLGHIRLTNERDR